jgi:hypothetical protein
MQYINGQAVYMEYIYKNAVYIHCEWYISCKEKKKKKKDSNIYLDIKKQYICNIYTKMQYIYNVSGIYFVKKKKTKKR